MYKRSLLRVSLATIIAFSAITVTTGIHPVVL